MRKKLVETLQKKGITNQEVLKAINKIPRHLFMDSGFINHAYVDKAFPIGADQTISQPYTVARQSELLNLNKGDKILEIGNRKWISDSCFARNGDDRLFNRTPERTL